MNTKLRIIVSGLVGLYPVGGVAWDYLQYVLGLSKLGHDVYYHEDTLRWPYNPIENQHVADGAYSAKFIGNFFETYSPELSHKWHYLHMQEKSFGMDRTDFDKIAQTADLFLNVSGGYFIPDHLSGNCVKVFLDTDPGYNQIILNEQLDSPDLVNSWFESVADHDRHFTYAENINNSDCIIPKLGFRWETTRMPIVLDLWSRFTEKGLKNNTPWTTVMSWNEFKRKLIHQGMEYKGKAGEFEKILDLPRYLDVPLMIAMGGVEAPLEKLREHGWEITDGPKATLTPGRYQELIAGSRGEISIAKNIYVAMRSGWFSCRSACYLAAGRPVITQDTRFGKVLPTGEGLFSFNTIEEILTAFEQIGSDYDKHCKAARDIAAEHFRAETVLAKLLDDLNL